MKITRLACYVLMGIVLSSGGITLSTWQFYVAIALVAAVASLSEYITVARFP
jgi:hypothetical protein